MYQMYSLVKILNDVHPEMQISPRASLVINNLLDQLKDVLLTKASELAEGHEKKVMSSREIQSALTLIYVGKVAKHAVSKGVQAVSKAFSSADITITRRYSAAGLDFSVSEVETSMRNKISMKVSLAAAIYLTAVLEYTSSELLEISGNFAKDDHVDTITAQHVKKVLIVDDEINKTLANANIVINELGADDDAVQDITGKKKFSKKKKINVNTTEDQNVHSYEILCDNFKPNPNPLLEHDILRVYLEELLARVIVVTNYYRKKLITPDHILKATASNPPPSNQPFLFSTRKFTVLLHSVLSKVAPSDLHFSSASIPLLQQYSENYLATRNL